MNFEKIAIMLAWILFTCFVAFMGTFYIQREMAKGAQLANKYANMLKDEGFTGKRLIEGFSAATSYQEINSQPLVNFYIASCYNSCCTGEFQNGYVDLKALEAILNHGVRGIDLEIYMSLKNQPIIGAGVHPQINSKIACQKHKYDSKGTYNHVTVNEAFALIKNLGFSGPPNNNDPLFINLRIKASGNKDGLYSSLADLIERHFKGHLLGPSYASEGKDKLIGKNLALAPLKSLKRKIIIMVEDFCDDYKQNKRFYAFVNLSPTSSVSPKGKIRVETGFSVANTVSLSEFKKDNLMSLCMTYPLNNPENNMVDNSNWQSHHAYGCQFVFMNYSKLSEKSQAGQRMKTYNQKFRGRGKQIILKPKELMWGPREIPIPKPMNKPEEDPSVPQKRCNEITGECTKI